MPELSGFSYNEVQFTKDAKVSDESEVDGLLQSLSSNHPTDLLVLAHGWNNDMDDARSLYRHFLASLRAVIDSGRIPAASGHQISAMAVLWPSKKFAERDLIAGGAAGVGDEDS